MHRHNVEGVVDLELGLDEADRGEAERTRDESQHEATEGPNEARRRRDRSQASDGAGGDTD